MSMQTLERAILAEAKQVFKNPKLRMKDIAEWSTSKSAVEATIVDGEVMAELPAIGVWACVRIPNDRRVTQTKGT